MTKSTYLLIFSLLFSSVLTGLKLLPPEINRLSMMPHSESVTLSHVSHHGGHQTSQHEVQCDHQGGAELPEQMASDCEQQCQASHCMSNSCFSGQSAVLWPLQSAHLGSFDPASLPVYHPNSLYRPPIAS